MKSLWVTNIGEHRDRWDAGFRSPLLRYIRIYEIIYARGLTFAGNPRNAMRDCNLLCCFRACLFAHFEHARY